MGLFNSTCPLPKAYVDLPNVEETIVGSVTFQNLMLYIAAGCAAVTTFTTFTLMLRHLLCYTRPAEQRQIIRIVFYPVVFAIMSTFSIYSYPDSLYLEPAQEVYEAVALVSLFFLYVEYAAPDQESREFYFTKLEHRKQKGGRFSRKKGYDVVPGGSLRWYQSKWVAIYFYFVATVVIHVVEEITQAAGRYCESSFSPAFAHIWVMVISDLALPVGVLAVVQLYWRMKNEGEFNAHKALAKLISFKAVILLNFFQGILFDILTGTHSLKASPPTITVRDWTIGLKALLVVFEQMLVSIWFNWSFSSNEYRAAGKASHARLSVWAAALHALNPTDLFQGAVHAFRLLVKGVGPRGNGSWRRSGGYNKILEQQGVQYQSATGYGYPHALGETNGRDEEYGSEHVLLSHQSSQVPSEYNGANTQY